MQSISKRFFCGTSLSRSVAELIMRFVNWNVKYKHQFLIMADQICIEHTVQ